MAVLRTTGLPSSGRAIGWMVSRAAGGPSLKTRTLRYTKHAS